MTLSVLFLTHMSPSPRTLILTRKCQDVFNAMMPNCRAAERAVSNSTLFNRLVAAAAAHPAAKWHVGGNAALMAQSFLAINPDNTVTLGGANGPRVRAALGDHIGYPHGTVLDLDEIHLILEYKAGDEWAGHSAKCANRLIVTRDVFNAELRALEPLQAVIRTNAPELFVVSGLNIMESASPGAWFKAIPSRSCGRSRCARVSEDMWDAMLQRLHQLLAAVPRSTLIHLELGSFGNPSLLRRVASTLLPVVDSLGLNEQELSAVCQQLELSNYCEHIMSHPRVADVADTAEALIARHGREHGRLSRVHFHALAFHLSVQVGSWRRGVLLWLICSVCSCID
jgi:ADP-dependent glucokinase